MKDLENAEKALYMPERKKLLTKGWCAKLLGLQDANGLWSASLYNGKWISTTYTLYLLKLFGLLPFSDQAMVACARLFTQGLYADREIRFSRNQSIQDLGVTGLILSLCCYFGYHHENIHTVAHYLIGQQGKEGNWLPNDAEESLPYTFDTTLLILEGLLHYRLRYTPSTGEIARGEARGQEFLLKHELYLDGGKPIKPSWMSFAFPPYWFYDVLSALDYFRQFRENSDDRLQAGMDLVSKKQNPDQTWNLGRKHPGKTHVEMEDPRKPSKWNTLRALRVLKWWESNM